MYAGVMGGNRARKHFAGDPEYDIGENRPARDGTKSRSESVNAARSRPLWDLLITTGVNTVTSKCRRIATRRGGLQGSIATGYISKNRVGQDRHRP